MTMAGPPEVPAEIPVVIKTDDAKTIDVADEPLQIEINMDGSTVHIRDRFGRCIFHATNIKDLEVLDHRNDGNWRNKTWHKNAPQIEDEDADENE